MWEPVRRSLGQLITTKVLLLINRGTRLAAQVVAPSMDSIENRSAGQSHVQLECGSLIAILERISVERRLSEILESWYRKSKGFNHEYLLVTAPGLTGATCSPKRFVCDIETRSGHELFASVECARLIALHRARSCSGREDHSSAWQAAHGKSE